MCADEIEPSKVDISIFGWEVEALPMHDYGVVDIAQKDTKTRQDKTRQDKTRQDKTRQDMFIQPIQCQDINILKLVHTRVPIKLL